MTVARKDMAEMAMARSHIYGFLAAVFRAEPSVAFLEELKAPGFVKALESLGLGLGNDLRAANCDDLAEDLAVEFTRLFIGPGPHVTPHESANIDFGNAMEATLWGPQTVEVKKFVEAAGLEFDDAFTGMPDHISAELEFMQKLATKEAEAWAEPEEEHAMNILKIERRFLDEHLSRWVQPFCDKVAERSEHPFYRDFAKVTKAFVAFDDETLRGHLAESEKGSGGPDRPGSKTAGKPSVGG